MNLNELTKKISDVMLRANVNIEDIPHNSRAAHSLVKRQAQDLLADLTVEYKTQIADEIAAVLLPKTSHTNAFLKAGAKDFVCEVDTNALYARLAQKVFPSIGKDNAYLVDHAAMLMQEIYQVANANGITLQDSLDYPNKEQMFSLEQFTSFVKNSMRAKYGDMFNLQVIKNEILNRLFAQLYSKDFVPVVIYNLDPDEATTFSKVIKHNLLVNLEDSKKVDKKIVTSTLVNLNHKFEINK